MPAPVTLSPIGLQHAREVQHLASDPDVAATTNLPEPYPEGSAQEWIRWMIPRHTRGEEFAFAILKGGVLVGVCGFHDVDHVAGDAELGYWIGKPFWGKGYATSGCRLALTFAFETVELHRVFARPLARNEASCRVLEKLGFTRRSLVENPFPKWKPNDPLVLYEIMRTRFRRAIS